MLGKSNIVTLCLRACEFSEVITPHHTVDHSEVKNLVYYITPECFK